MMGTNNLFIRFKLNHLLLMIRSSASNFHLNVIAHFQLGTEMSLTTACRILNKRLFRFEICWRRKLCSLLYSKIPCLTLTLWYCVVDFLEKETQGLKLKNEFTDGANYIWAKGGLDSDLWQSTYSRPAAEGKDSASDCGSLTWYFLCYTTRRSILKQK